MPELPEVETIVRALREGGRKGPALPGRTIARVDLRWQRSLAEPSPQEFSARLPGQSIAAISRRGKFLIFHLSHHTLLIHLRMSGDIRVEEDAAPEAAHDRLLLIFTDGLRLVFNDPRKFGRVWLVSQPEHILGELGPEPLDPALTAADFHARLQGKHRQLKPLLLDQGFIAGLGNIYTDEALHLAGLHPLQPSHLLGVEQAARLLAAIREVLQEGIRRNGASIDWVYRGGSFQNSFRVYQRDGQACPTCGAHIKRMVIGQRSSHYCPICQPLYN